jgi:hypothetical protein
MQKCKVIAGVKYCVAFKSFEAYKVIQMKCEQKSKIELFRPSLHCVVLHDVPACTQLLRKSSWRQNVGSLN